MGLKGTVPDCSSPSGGDPSVSWIATTSRRAALYSRLAARVCVWVGEGWSGVTEVIDYELEQKRGSLSPKMHLRTTWVTFRLNVLVLVETSQNWCSLAWHEATFSIRWRGACQTVSLYCCLPLRLPRTSPRSCLQEKERWLPLLQQPTGHLLPKHLT